MLQEVLHNLQVSFNSVHVRYEDATSSPGAPFAIGLTLKTLQAFTTDSAGNRKFCVDTSVQHKWLELTHLALYHHVHCAERTPEDTTLDALTSWLGGMVAGAKGQYVIAPMDIGARVAMRPDGPALAAGAQQPLHRLAVRRDRLGKRLRLVVLVALGFGGEELVERDGGHGSLPCTAVHCRRCTRPLLVAWSASWASLTLAGGAFTFA